MSKFNFSDATINPEPHTIVLWERSKVLDSGPISTYRFQFSMNIDMNSNLKDRLVAVWRSIDRWIDDLEEDPTVTSLPGFCEYAVIDIHSGYNKADMETKLCTFHWIPLRDTTGLPTWTAISNRVRSLYLTDNDFWSASCRLTGNEYAELILDINEIEDDDA
jgi:hypothetical protein